MLPHLVISRVVTEDGNGALSLSQTPAAVYQGVPDVWNMRTLDWRFATVTNELGIVTGTRWP